MRTIVQNEHMKSSPQIQRYLNELVPIPKFQLELRAHNNDWNKLNQESFKYIVYFLTSQEILQLRFVSRYFLDFLSLTFNDYQQEQDISQMRKANKLMLLAKQHKETCQNKQFKCWMKLKKDHFKSIIAFLDHKQILELRLVNTIFLKNIILCYPVILYQLRCECKIAQEQLEQLNQIQITKEFEEKIQIAKHHLAAISTQDICVVKSFSNPPPTIAWITNILRNLVSGTKMENNSYSEAKQIYRNPNQLIQQLNQFDYKHINDFQISEIQRITENEEIKVTQVSSFAGCFYRFVDGLRMEIDVLKQFAKRQKLAQAIDRNVRLEKIFKN